MVGKDLLLAGYGLTTCEPWANGKGALISRSERIPPTRLANGLLFGRLYEKKDPGGAHQGVEDFARKPESPLTSDIRHG